MSKPPNDGELEQAKRIVERLVKTPSKPHRASESDNRKRKREPGEPDSRRKSDQNFEDRGDAK